MYLLHCANNTYYTGSTKDLERRLAQHQNAEGANYTKKHAPVELVYYETYSRIDHAFEREHQVKKWSRAKKEALINDFPEKLETVTTIKWDKKSRSVIAGKELKYGALILEKEMIKKPDPESIISEMIEGIKLLGLGCLPWNKKLRQYQARAVFFI